MSEYIFMMYFGRFTRVGNVLIFLAFITGCRRIPVIDDPKDKILFIDYNCNIFGVDAKSGISEMIVRSPSGECIDNPIWVNDTEFVYYIDPLRGTPSTIYPLILVNVKTGKQRMIYKGRKSLGSFNHYTNKKIIMQDGTAFTRIRIFDIKHEEISEPLVLYPELRRMSFFNVLPEKDSLVLQGVDTIKYKDLPHTQSGYIIPFSDSLDDIYLYDIGEDELIQLTDTRWSDINPAWSPDGKYITFASNKAGNYDIYVMELETREIKQLTSGEGNDQYPEYSPDGSKIAFISDRSGEEQVWLMDSDGNNKKQITRIRGGVGGRLSWNPKK